MGIVSTDGMPTSGEPRGGEELDIITKLGEIFAEFNGNIDLANLSSALRSSLDLSPRGQSVIATEQTRASSSYATLDTPDEVTLASVPANSFVCVHWEAQWKQANSNTARAWLYVDDNQYGVEASISTPDTWYPMEIGQEGLNGGESTSVGGVYVIPSSAVASDVTVDVRFKSTDASVVTVRNRVLSVWTEGF